MNWTLPVINLDRCTGCGQCVRHCPTQAVELIECRAVIVRPFDCTYCDACERACPTGAIGRPFIVVFETGQRWRRI
ncbi:ATP-binding protein [Roseiflexus sp.]|uniref:ATP-binding protein n=1 Tax=Roseiflexus sp. TaxID=2562120 RepID=UPI0021DEFA50|nr:4Fe-4S binding protein [Roseiflexus sp.]GIW02563.1 MAG: 4Fe-4S ferredoxin [Roseiflexus sp.]